jgi:TPR repeat protein
VRVRWETKEKQEPWNYSSLTKPFCFADCERGGYTRTDVPEPETLYKNGVKAYNTGKYVQAIKWYKKAAKRKHSEAQYELGLMYKTGRGVRMNNRKACHWFRQSAAQGNRQAIRVKRNCSP